MKNYKTCSFICDRIDSIIFQLKVIATDPNNSESSRLIAQRNLCSILSLARNLVGDIWRP